MNIQATLPSPLSPTTLNECFRWPLCEEKTLPDEHGVAVQTPRHASSPAMRSKLIPCKNKPSPLPLTAHSLDLIEQHQLTKPDRRLWTPFRGPNDGAQQNLSIELPVLAPGIITAGAIDGGLLASSSSNEKNAPFFPPPGPAWFKKQHRAVPNVREPRQRGQKTKGNQSDRQMGQKETRERRSDGTINVLTCMLGEIFLEILDRTVFQERQELKSAVAREGGRGGRGGRRSVGDD